MAANINWLGAGLATLAALLLAALWYSPIMFGRIWRENVSASRNGQDRMSKVKRALIVIPAAFASAVIFAAFLGNSLIGLSSMAGFAAGTFWVALSLGISYALEPRTFVLWAVNSAYHILQFTLYGVCIGGANTYL